MENKKLIVIGGGHAGVEAAAAIARMECEVTLITRLQVHNNVRIH